MAEEAEGKICNASSAPLLPPAFLCYGLAMDAWQHGVKLFNAGEFWECHEALEPPWMNAAGLEKEFYAGVILLAAALHKARKMESSRGGRRNYAKALVHLAVVPDVFHGVDVRELEATVHDALRHPYKEPKIPLLNSRHDGKP
jgi:uncharacterized protein